MTQQILDAKAKTKKKTILKHLSKVGISMISLAFMASGAGAIDSASPVKPSDVPKHTSGFFEKSKKAVKSAKRCARKIITSKPVTIYSAVALFFIVIVELAKPDD